jgi:hypothetical protein
MDGLESLVERRIREATAQGAFANLPGAGQPLDLRDADDPDWWITRLARREQIDPASLLPPTLALRREADEFPASLLDLTREEQVRAVLVDFNERVRTDWRRPAAGPSLPSPAQEVDVEALVAAWHRLRQAPREEPLRRQLRDGDPTPATRARGRRRWPRLGWWRA